MLVVASGFLFGFPRGFALVYPSALTGSMIAFLIGRKLPPKWRNKMPKALTSLQSAVHSGGFTTLFLLRLTPLPFAFSNLFLGSTAGVPFWSHAGATALGFLRLALNSYLGTMLGETLKGGAGADGGSATLERALTVGGTLCAMAAMGNVGRRMLNQAAEESRQKELKQQ